MNKSIVTGIKPTNSLHIGNLFGSILNFKSLIQKKNYESFFFIADLHALTTQRSVSNNQSLEMLSYIIPILGTSCKYFIQSRHTYITQIHWIMSCLISRGQLERMTQYKQYHKDINNLGLLSYPILMASDIISLGSTHVPVGDDQKQHIELARDLIMKFNTKYHSDLTLSESVIMPLSRIYNLKNTDYKMSKSYGSSKGVIYLTDSSTNVYKKIKGATTHSDRKMPQSLKELSNKPGLLNLYNIYTNCEGISLLETLNLFKDMNILSVKEKIYKSLWSLLSQIQNSKLNITEVKKTIQRDENFVNNKMKSIWMKIYSKILEQ